MTREELEHARRARHVSDCHRASLDALAQKASAYENDREYNAELVHERDRRIAAALALLDRCECGASVCVDTRNAIRAALSTPANDQTYGGSTMNMDCPKCDEYSHHYHCRRCDLRIMSGVVKYCPSCGVPDPTREDPPR